MRLILVRHGETVENRRGIIQGHAAGSLSARGVLQSRKLAVWLKSEKIDAIYSSDLLRARIAAEEIAKFHPKAVLQFFEELRERDFGPYTGIKESEIASRKKFKGIESKQSMSKRVKKMLALAYERYPNGTVLFVGHGSINKALVRTLLKIPPAVKIEQQENAAISRFEIIRGKEPSVLVNNC